MKVNNVMGSKPVNDTLRRLVDAVVEGRSAAPAREINKKIVEAAPAIEQSEPDEVEHKLLFQPSESFKHILSLIAKSDKKLYNRIIGLE
jgi:hypothetical protein